MKLAKLEEKFKYLNVKYEIWDGGERRHYIYKRPSNLNYHWLSFVSEEGNYEELPYFSYGTGRLFISDFHDYLLKYAVDYHCVVIFIKKVPTRIRLNTRIEYIQEHYYWYLVVKIMDEYEEIYRDQTAVQLAVESIKDWKTHGILLDYLADISVGPLKEILN